MFLKTFVLGVLLKIIPYKTIRLSRLSVTCVGRYIPFKACSIYLNVIRIFMFASNVLSYKGQRNGK